MGTCSGDSPAGPSGSSTIGCAIGPPWIPRSGRSARTGPRSSTVWPSRSNFPSMAIAPAAELLRLTTVAIKLGSLGRLWWPTSQRRCSHRARRTLVNLNGARSSRAGSRWGFSCPASLLLGCRRALFRGPVRNFRCNCSGLSMGGVLELEHV